MYTSVKLRVGAKKKLKELQAKLRLRGVKVGLHDILEKLIELGLEEEEKLINRFRLETVEEDSMLKLLEKPLDWGIRDVSIKIDEALYGGNLGGAHRYRNIRSSEE